LICLIPTKQKTKEYDPTAWSVVSMGYSSEEGNATPVSLNILAVTRFTHKHSAKNYLNIAMALKKLADHNQLYCDRVN
jgi:hypothetical protein